MIGIVDYNAGNITSVERTLEKLNIKYIRSQKADELKNCDKLIFPGVGDANYAMDQLKSLNLIDFLKNWVKEDKPMLGICLGSQIIFDHSEEGNTDCLGLIAGDIRLFYSLKPDMTEKVPQIGYNNLDRQNGVCPILKDVPENADFYFVHSYVICPKENDVIKATADYGVKVPAVIQKGNLFACQFHPEKSGVHGLKIIQNFAEL